MENKGLLNRDVTIIGAGVIGVLTAIQLQRAGHKVTVIDRAEPAAACSSGNAGILAAYGVAPLSQPGMLAKVPGMLLDPLGPLSVRRQYMFKIAPWLWQFWRAGTPDKVEHIASALSGLVGDTVAAYQALARGTPAASLIRPQPVLCAYADEQAYRNDQQVWDLRARHGVQWHVVKQGEVRDLEPALDPSYQFAAVFEHCGYTVNPQRLVRAFFDEFIENGGNYIRDEVQTVVVGAGGPEHIKATGGDHAASCVVVACGAWSGQLSRRLGEAVPLEAERGYHITLSGYEGRAPSHPVMSPSQKVIATPMETGLRIAGMVEFGGFLPPDYRRSEILRRHLSTLFPGVTGGAVSSWMGHRPSLPDSLPVIGPSSRHPSLYYAFGHQHIGLTTAPMTGRLLAECITGMTPSVDMAPFRIDRF